MTRAENKQFNILNVEDDLVSRVLLSLCLKSEGYNPIEAADGKEAIDILFSNRIPIHLIITDIFMPHLDGNVLTLTVKSNPKWAHIPIIIHTATYISNTDQEYALSIGAHKFMRKPQDTPDLILEIGRILHHDDATTNELA